MGDWLLFGGHSYVQLSILSKCVLLRRVREKIVSVAHQGHEECGMEVAAWSSLPALQHLPHSHLLPLLLLAFKSHVMWAVVAAVA